MHRGLPEGNTKLVLIFSRPWALSTLGRVFGCFSGSFHLLATSTEHRLMIRLQYHVFHVHTCTSSAPKGDAYNMRMQICYTTAT